jgi:hypothetical protein
MTSTQPEVKAGVVMPPLQMGKLRLSVGEGPILGYMEGLWLSRRKMVFVTNTAVNPGHK